MGEIAEAMLDGSTCEMCGVDLGQEPSGFPMYCSQQCAKDRGADPSQVVEESEEDWEQYRQERREKKERNRKFSLKLLKQKGIEAVMLSDASGHYRVGEYDFWPATGKFIHRPTSKHGRGVQELIKLLSTT